MRKQQKVRMSNNRKKVSEVSEPTRPGCDSRPLLLARRQTLWGEPVSERTAEVDSEAAFVPFEWQLSPIPPTEAVQGSLARLADDPATWNASTAELIDWFRANRDWLPSEPFCLWPGAWVVDPALFYHSLDADIDHGPDGPCGKLGGLSHDLRCPRGTTAQRPP